MTQFRGLAPGMLVAPQIAPEDIAAAKAVGVGLIINNRPDGESPDQPDGSTIEAAARAAGIAYRAIPVSGMMVGESQVAAMRDALDSAEGPVLAYCRSGTRSTLLWSLAKASRGEEPDAIARAAAAAGYDIAPIRSMLDDLAARAAGDMP
jgi:uncharacterized protein (TIGR01244 family)